MSEIKRIATDNAPQAIGPYSQGLAFGNLVFASGQIPVDPAAGTMPETIEEQTQQCFNNIKGILAEAGCSIGDVIKTTVFLADLGDFAAMNAVYEQNVADPAPARSCVQVAAIPKGAKVEIECIAVKRD